MWIGSPSKKILQKFFLKALNTIIDMVNIVAGINIICFSASALWVLCLLSLYCSTLHWLLSIYSLCFVVVVAAAAAFILLAIHGIFVDLAL